MIRHCSLHASKYFSTARNLITSEKFSGFNSILERAAAILHNVSYEDQRVLVLQLHTVGPCKELVKMKSRHIDIEACIEPNAHAELQQSEIDKYLNVQICNYLEPLPYKNQQFKVIACLLPPDFLANQPFSPPLEEIGRVLEDEAYALIGASESVWTKQNLLNNLQKVKDCSLVSAIDLNCAKDPLKESYYFGVLAKKSFE